MPPDGTWIHVSERRAHGIFATKHGNGRASGIVNRSLALSDAGDARLYAQPERELPQMSQLRAKPLKSLNKKSVNH